METITRTFNKVLECLNKLASDIINPKDREFKIMHTKLYDRRFYPFFNNAIGAIDRTHIPVAVPMNEAIVYTNKNQRRTHNVLAICDFDMRFTFVAAGCPGSAHDYLVFKDARKKYGAIFPHPPLGKFYLVDLGYENEPGYLAPYRSAMYTEDPEERGLKEIFNTNHASLRNVVERSFGVLKNKWRILFDIPNYHQTKQSKIIVACMALHNFIRDNDVHDPDFSMAVFSSLAKFFSKESY